MANNVLIIGAGKSATILIEYCLEQAPKLDTHITIADLQPDQIALCYGENPRCSIMALDIHDQVSRRKAIQASQIVISMLPAALHILAAQDCLEFGVHLVTASYVSEALNKMDSEVKAKGLVFMNEIGLDPGLDHMSAMRSIDHIRNQGGNMILFESFTGGLVSPECDNNPWQYKFTWNPRNVVIAGQGGTAQFIQEGSYKYIPYHKLFRRTEFLDIPQYGRFEAYANRDSLKYREAYGLENALTLYRGTIRRVGFSKAWNMFIQLGLTDDSFVMENSEGMSYRSFINAFLPYSPSDSVELKLRHYLKIDQDDSIWEKLESLDLFSTQKKIPLVKASPAQILQYILEQTWSMGPQDKDMIVMYHKFGYELNGKKYQRDANMVVIGENSSHTAMAKTVGLPVAMAAHLILKNKLNTPGVQIPIRPEVYTPILNQMEHHGIQFKEYEVPYLGYNPNRIIG